MDLGTVRRRLLTGGYSGADAPSAWAGIAADVRRTFANARLYNPATVR